MPAEYPKRPDWFSHWFVRLMGRVCLAGDLGPEVCWMLAHVVHTEDAARYRRPVSFFNEDLATRTGLSLAGMKRARDKAVKAGWLHHESGARGRAGRYWVLVPEWAEELEEKGRIPAQPEPVSGRVDDTPGAIVAQAEPESLRCTPDSGGILAQGEPVSEPLSSPPIPSQEKDKEPPIPPVPGGGEISDPPKTPPRKKRRTPEEMEADPLFVSFWAKYPRREGKTDAAKAFAKLNPDESLLAQMFAALEWQSTSDKWLSDGGQFVPYPANWLKGKRWRDEPPKGTAPLDPREKLRRQYLARVRNGDMSREEAERVYGGPLEPDAPAAPAGNRPGKGVIGVEDVQRMREDRDKRKAG